MTTGARNTVKIATFALVVAFLCALVPLGPQNSGRLDWSVAYAEEAYDANAFLSLAAEAADVSGSLLVSTIGEIVTITTGHPVSTTGLSPRAQLAGNVGSLIDAADYPDWESLTDEERGQWGNKENYDKAKFNALMRGFGLGGDLDEFKGSQGGSFTFSDAAKKRLKQIGRIGSLWAGGAAVKIQELQDMIADMQTVDAWFVPGESSPQIDFDATDIDDWPSGLPKNLTIGYGSECHIYKSDGSDWMKYPFSSSRDVFWLLANKSGTNSIWVFAFDPNTFGFRTIGSSGSYTEAPVQNVSGYEPFYCQGYNSGLAGWRSNMPINVFSGSASWKEFYKACAIMIAEEIAPQSSGGVLIPDYPDDPVDPEERVYMPNDGIGTENNSYNYYFIAPTVERPVNPYNPDDQTGGNEWAEDTTANVLPLAQLPFDKLFPFCLLYDLPLLLHKIMDVSYTDAGGGLRAQSVPDYEKIVLDIPQPEGLETWHLEIELTWLKDLLVLVRPALQVLLLVGFLWGSISFWKAVITG